MLEEKSIIDKIEILLDGQIQVRTRNQILKNGVEVSATFHRHVLAPGDSLDQEDPKVIKIAQAIWNQDVVSNYSQQTQNINLNN